MRPCGRTARVWVVLAVPFLLAMDRPDYRFHRPIEGAAGWTEVELPDDVLDRARPGLPDVRVLSAIDEEMPYAIGGPRQSSPVKLALFDREQTAEETTALADRGANAPRADAVELEVRESEFIKPITLEASADRGTWGQIARGAIFATRSGARMMRLHFAPNDRRYWRFRFDDRHGPPIDVTQVVAGLAPSRETPPRVIGLELQAEPDATLSATTYTAALPSGNLPLSALRMGATDAAFVRRARIFERVWLRDEVSRRLLGEREIVRSGSGADQTSISLSEPIGKHLELEIERSSGVPLHGVTAEVVVETPILRFFAPSGSTPSLVYGSNESGAPAYDVAAALRSGSPTSFTRARLGVVFDTGPQVLAAPAITRGVAIETAGWKNEQPIRLPTRGPIAYLDLERGAESLRDVRILDQSRRQVPYIVETEPRHARFAVEFRVERAASGTRLHLDALGPGKGPIDAIELEITSPEYFERDVQVFEQSFDQRGKTDLRAIGNAHLVKTADQRATAFRIAVARPEGPHLTIHIADGDNAPLVVGSVSVEKSRRRLNFVFAPDDELRLLSENDAANAPKYDLALVASQVLSAPAEAAALGPTRTIAAQRKHTPAWFWIFVLAAALMLLLALGRTLAKTQDRAG